jgi:Uma2 family endonuclease
LQRHLLACLRKLLEEQNRDWFVNYEQKMNLDPHDQRIGVLPDLYVLPCQPEDPNFSEWPAYDPSVPKPVFALEAVSRSNWDKDYVESPQKYAKLGVEELLLFDELALEGRSPASEPYVLQLYRKDRRGALKRVYAGEGPVYSQALRGWFRTVGNQLTVTRDEEGKSRIFTYEETERWWAKLEEIQTKAEEERQAREEAEKARKAAQDKAEQERRAKEKAEKARQAAQDKAEEERLAKEKAEAKAEQERRAKEEAEKAQQAAQQQAQDAERKADQERRAKEEAERQAQQERLAKEEAER